MTPTKEYQLSEFEQKVINNLDLIFDSFGIKYSERGDKYNFLCPIHGSTDITSACVYKSTGIALCFVGNCFNYNKNNLYGVQRLIGNLLNHYNIKKTVKEYCQDVFSGIKYDVKQNKPVEIKKKKQIIIPRSQLAGKTDGNIDFYLKRGFSQETIKKYDIFLCKRESIYYMVVWYCRYMTIAMKMQLDLLDALFIQSVSYAKNIICKHAVVILTHTNK